MFICVPVIGTSVIEGVGIRSVVIGTSVIKGVGAGCAHL